MSRKPLSEAQEHALSRLYDAAFLDGRTLRGLETRGLVMTIKTASGHLRAVLTGDGLDAAVDLIVRGRK